MSSLVAAIELWAEHWNDDPKPFIWHKPAEEIIEKVRRGRAARYQIKPRRTTREIMVNGRRVNSGLHAQA